MTRMTTSERGVALIKEFEGFVGHTYDDMDPQHLPTFIDEDGKVLRIDSTPARGVLTKGYGHTKTARPGDTLTEEEADALLREDLSLYEKAVERYITAPLNQNQFDALVSFTYNLGPAALKNSTARKNINERQYAAGAHALTWWNKWNGKTAAGLVRRRAAEKALFLEPPTAFS